MTQNELKQEILAHLSLNQNLSMGRIAEELMIDDREELRNTLSEMRNDGLIRMNKMKYSTTDDGIEALKPEFQEEQQQEQTLPETALPTEEQRQQLRQDIAQEQNNREDYLSKYLVSCGHDDLVCINLDEAEQTARHLSKLHGIEVSIFELKATLIGAYVPVTETKFILPSEMAKNQVAA